MERDFMGLTSKDSLVVVKEEALEGCNEPVFSKSSAVQWPSSNDFESFNTRQMGEIQGAHSKQVVQASVANAFFGSQFSGAPVKQQFDSGPFIAGTTEPRLKPLRAPVQLTIFYGGMVNVYDDISPEKAQAIMLLAGNGASVAAANTPHPRGQAQVPTPRTPGGDVSQPINAPPCSAISSPMSVSSHPVSQSAGRDEAAKTISGSGMPVSKVETPRLMSSLGQVMKSAVPQARKASLARFLEKRKERAMASAPYNASKSSSDCANHGSSDADVDVSTAAE